MKRVILSAAALAIGGFAFAQTPQTITPIVQQTSPTAAATVGGNYSDIDQKGIGSDAKVQQQGTANASFIEQTGTDVANRNSVDVLQWGNVQPSISGHLNYSDIKQNGAGNDFMATQQGDENEISGLQNGLDNAALVQQGANTPQQAENNLAKVDQDGKDNYAEVQQRYDDNEASILQRNDAVAGVGNRSFQSQVSNPNQSAGQVAIGEQWGGDNNEAVQIQDSGSPALGGGNHAEIQQGDATTEATGAFAQQVQSGATNEAYATQYLSSDESFQEQLGTDNKAVVEQNTGGISSGGNNLVEQFQDGDRNEARSDQNGNGNTVNQEQYGQDNFSSVKQRYGQDAGNMATSIQDGSLNNSVINQQSHGNMSMVDQTGDGQTSLINQNNPTTGAAAAAGGYNNATVIQRNANVALTPQTRRIAASKRHTF